MKAPSHKIMMRIGIAIFLFGMALIPCWMLAGWIGGSRLATFEFPLGDPRDVATDSRGRIYVAETFYGRVQRYSPEGTFQRGWVVPTSGVFALRTTADDHVVVATARANKLLTYDADGDLVTGLYWQDIDRFQEFADERETTGGYVVRRGLLPHIEAANGRTVIATPAPKRLIAGPFPAAAYTAVGIALLGGAEWRRRRGGAR